MPTIVIKSTDDRKVFEEEFAQKWVLFFGGNISVSEMSQNKLTNSPCKRQPKAIRNKQEKNTVKQINKSPKNIKKISTIEKRKKKRERKRTLEDNLHSNFSCLLNSQLTK